MKLMFCLGRILYRPPLIILLSFYYMAKILLQVALNKGLESTDSRHSAQAWGQQMVKILNMHVHLEGNIEAGVRLYVANHTGFLDIPLWLSLFDVAFVAKKSVRRWPIFGTGAAAIGTIFVDRSSPQSRATTAQAVGQKIHRDQQSLIIFPEGTSSILGKPWRKGSFDIASKNSVLVQACAVSYNPVRPCAYIDQDTFITLLMRACAVKRIEIFVKLGPSQIITDPSSDCKRLQDWVTSEHHKKLMEFGYPLT